MRGQERSKRRNPRAPQICSPGTSVSVRQNNGKGRNDGDVGLGNSVCHYCYLARTAQHKNMADVGELEPGTMSRLWKSV